MRFYPKGFSRETIGVYIDKKRIFKNRFIFKNGFVDSLTTNFGQSVTLSNDKFEMFRNCDSLNSNTSDENSN